MFTTADFPPVNAAQQTQSWLLETLGFFPCCTLSLVIKMLQVK